MSALNDDILDKDFTLDHTNRVEASAGTGKTFSIQTLYLRLVVERGLRVQEILVVTFTDAATKELRDRLRKILDDALLHTGEEPSEEERVQKIMGLPKIEGGQTYDDKEKEKRWRVQRALLDFDEASISTIHGFCQRVLDRYGFLCSTDPDMEVAENDASAIGQACEDWWRKNTYASQDTDLFQLLNCLDIDVEKLARISRTHIKKPDSKLLPEAGTVENLKKELESLLSPENIEEVLEDDVFERDKFEPTRPAEKLQQDLEKLKDADASIWEALRRVRDALKVSGSNNPPAWKKVQAWVPGEDLLNVINACKEISEVTKGKRKTLYEKAENGRLTHPQIDDLNDKVERLQKRWPAGQAEWEKIKNDQSTYPCKSRAQSAKDIQKYLDASWDDLMSMFDSAADTIEGIKKIASFETSVADRITRQVHSTRAGRLFVKIQAGPYRVVARAVQEICEKYKKAKLQKRMMTFDDLLLNIRDGLSDEHGDALCSVLRDEYKAALIDEFQDTDPVQYEIFNRVFMGSKIPTWLVGDPKQAIYAFRGGDVYTYYRAGEQINDKCKWELSTNYRSDKRLVDAVNQIFRDPETGGGDATRTFGEEIKYDGRLQAGCSLDDEHAILSGDRESDRPFKLWFYTGQSGRQPPGMTSPFAKRVYADTAAEVVNILNDENFKIGKRRVFPQDIAILVMTHREAALIHEELKNRGVAAVCQSTGKVFDSPEAASFAYVLAACAEPRNPKQVRTALATMFFDCSHEELMDMLKDSETRQASTKEEESAAPATLDDWISVFQTAHELWKKESFIQAFNYLVANADMRETLVSREGGERSLTNLLQLSRLLHEAIQQQHLSMEGVLTWYARQLDPNRRDEGDQYELRLESDDNAVRIMTVFTSKGLEFPIVFAPTLWRRDSEPMMYEEAWQYHAEDEEGEPHCINLDKQDQGGRGRMVKERLAENVRLLYVATTRAKHRTYLVWGDFRAEPEKYALARVLGNTNPTGLLTRKLNGGETLAVDIVEKAFPSDDPVFVHYQPSKTGTQKELSVSPKPRVDKSHRHTSFSGLVPHAGNRPAGVDERLDNDEQDTLQGEASESAVLKKLDIYSFPRGAKIGTCWHSIFEELDFTATDRDIERIVVEQLGAYRLDRGRNGEIQDQKRQVVFDMVKNTLAANLGIRKEDAFQLKTIRPGDCRAEMQFDFALKDWGEGQPNQITDLCNVLKRHWKDGPCKLYLSALEGREGEIPQGFLTGFIDLVLRQNEKFYILDWKSNARNGTPGAFEHEGLIEEMAHHFYFLQYLIYTVALHQFLQGAMHDYDYDAHFGGVFYVFLRATQKGSPRGIYSDRPSKELIDDLSAVLGRFEP